MQASSIPVAEKGHGASKPCAVASYDTVVRKIVALERDAGVNGLLMTFPDFVPALREFGEHVLPRLRAREHATQAA